MSIERKVNKKNQSGYTYYVRINYFDDDGIKQRYYKSGFTNKKDAEEHEHLIKAKLINEGTLQKPCEKTLNEVFDEMIEVDVNRYAHNTLLKTKGDKKYFQNELGNKIITKISYKILQDYFNNRSDKGIETNKNIKKALNRAFDYALRCDYIKSNPIVSVKVYGVENKHKKIALTVEQFNVLLDELENYNCSHRDNYVIAVKIAYCLGLRLSETFALNKSDFDFINDTVNIDKVLIFRGLKNEHFYTDNKMKSKTSKCVLPLPNILKKDLLVWFEFNEFERVLCDDEGNYLNPNILVNILSRISKKVGFPISFHELRHSFATNLYMNNVDIKTSQELMRHANINTTLSIYTHINDEDKKKTINNTLNNLFNINNEVMH